MAFIRRRDLSLAFLYLPRLTASSSFVIGKSNRSQPSVQLSAMAGGKAQRGERERGVRNFPVNTFLHILQLPSLIQPVVSKSDALSMNLRTFGVRGEDSLFTEQGAKSIAKKSLITHSGGIFVSSVKFQKK